MIDRRIGKIKVRRGTDLQRKQFVFEEGEIIYTTDTMRTFIGDGLTLGGKRVSNRNYILTAEGVPSTANYGDIVYVSTTRKTYIVGTDDGQDVLNPSLKLFLIADLSVGDDFGERIEQIWNKLTSLTGCLAVIKPPTIAPPVTVEFKWFIEPVSKNVNYGDTVVLTARATGPFSDITYVWQRLYEGIYKDIPNKIGESFEIYNFSPTDIAYYRCVATSKAGVLNSIPAFISVESNLLLAENGNFIVTETDGYIEI